MEYGITYKECPKCGNTFYPLTSKTKYCAKCRGKSGEKEGSDKRAKHNFKARYISEEIRTCPVCGKKFHPRTYNHTYCSEECRIKHYMEGKPVRKICIVKKCAGCGRYFQSNSEKQKYCSPECRNSYYSRKKKIERLNHKDVLPNKEEMHLHEEDKPIRHSEPNTLIKFGVRAYFGLKRKFGNIAQRYSRA